nr:mitochondrial thiamine pyrophosphate carrier-like [Onthophagus taurus]
MLGERRNNSKLNQVHFVIAGATSGAVTRAVCQPLDVVKIRFQLQAEPICYHSISKYKSVTQAVILIYNEEGVKAFWKGHIPAQLLSIVYGCAQFGTYELFMKSFGPLFHQQFKPVKNFIGGSIAGGVATVVSFPFDVIRTRLIGQCDKLRAYRSIIHAFVHIYKNENFKAYFRGLTPTIVQVAPHAGSQFMFYKLFDRAYKKVVGIEETRYSATSCLIAGSLSGFCAKLAIYPFDFVRKRMQVQGFQRYRRNFGKGYSYNGMMDAFEKTIKQEGFNGLFKGLTPSLLKAVFTTALHFSTYEFVCQYLEEYN